MWLATIISIVFGFFIGLEVGFSVREIVDAIKAKVKPAIRFKKYEIGSPTFSFCLIKLRGCNDLIEESISGLEVKGQINGLQNQVKRIIGLTDAYNLRQFQTIEIRDLIQKNIDAFIKNIENFNEFLKRPKLVVSNNFEEATKELIKANQPLLDSIKKIEEEIYCHIDNGTYQLIDFNHP